MKSSKNVMIGLMVVIGVVLMISLTFSPFMSGLEGFQEGAGPNVCAAAKRGCTVNDRKIVKDIINKKPKWLNGHTINNEELASTGTEDEKRVMGISSCKNLITGGCSF